MLLLLVSEKHFYCAYCSTSAQNNPHASIWSQRVRSENNNCRFAWLYRISMLVIAWIPVQMLSVRVHMSLTLHFSLAANWLKFNILQYMQQSLYYKRNKPWMIIMQAAWMLINLNATPPPPPPHHHRHRHYMWWIRSFELSVSTSQLQFSTSVVVFFIALFVSSVTFTANCAPQRFAIKTFSLCNLFGWCYHPRVANTFF